MIDDSWKKIGKEDPYYGVLTSDAYKGRQLTEDAVRSFYETGYEHVNFVYQQLLNRFHLPSGHRFHHVLDFGCGTGRLVIPFAEKAGRVTGVDISEGMIAEAKLRVNQKALSNVELLQLDDVVAHRFQQKFDLVHSFIVLQHINENYGHRVFEKLVSLVDAGGFGAIHLVFAGNKNRKDIFIANLKRKYRWFNMATNLAAGRPVNRPFMQMNYYDLNKVFSILYAHGATDISTDYTNHGGFLGIIIFFRKNK